MQFAGVNDEVSSGRASRIHAARAPAEPVLASSKRKGRCWESESAATTVWRRIMI
jgi:hypothetical protein